MVDFSLKLIAGLGNPGKEYFQTRHNIGFRALDALIAKISTCQFEKILFDSYFVKTKFADYSLCFTKPMTYMNRSGFSIQRIASYYKIPIQNIVVVHDDIDLAFGDIKISKSRGHGGHNGVRSIIDSLNSNDFIRVRIGIGRTIQNGDRADYVLGAFTPDEKLVLDEIFNKAVDACIAIIKKGPTFAMNHINSLR